MNPNLQNNSSNNFSGGNINGYGNTITNNVDQSRRTKITIGSIAVVVVLLLIGFGIFKATGGGGSDRSKLVGTWGYEMGGGDFAPIISLHSDGTCELSKSFTHEMDMSGTWDVVEDNQLRITVNFFGNVTALYHYEINGKTLTLTDEEEEFVLTKK